MSRPKKQTPEEFAAAAVAWEKKLVREKISEMVNPIVNMAKTDDEAKRMARRDYMAAEAMSAIVATTTADVTPIYYRIKRWLFGTPYHLYRTSDFTNIAQTAYHLADHMLRVRDEQPREIKK